MREEKLSLIAFDELCKKKFEDLTIEEIFKQVESLFNQFFSLKYFLAEHPYLFKWRIIY
jgi:hypothetical protein